MNYHTLKELQDLSDTLEKETWEIVQEADMEENERSASDSYEKMLLMYNAMKEADAAYDGNLRSASKRAGGDGAKLHEYNERNKNICGPFMGHVMEKAIMMGESNACMRRIVAAPTAGSCGVIPAVLLPYYEMKQVPKEEILKALFVTGGIGEVIAQRASISGAEGGCQAEIGSASAMAAGALVYLQGGSDEQICHAAALALKGLLGLVCDPVAGLVEIPCVKRNVLGCVNAISCADMAMAGIQSRIPPDEVIDAMQEVGGKMDSAFRETALGGLAATKTGQEIMHKLMESEEDGTITT